MNKKCIIKQLSQSTHLTQKQCRTCLDELIKLISKNISKGEKFYLKSLGKFCIKTYKEKLVYNPTTQTKYLISARTVPVFRPSKKFAESIF